MKQIRYQAITYEIAPHFSDQKAKLLALPAAFRAGEGELVYKGRNELRRFTVDNAQWVVKSFRRPNLINRLVYGILRPSKAKRSFDNAQFLLQIGIGTPKPIGYVNQRSPLLFDRSYYVSLNSRCRYLYNDLFTHPFDEVTQKKVLHAIGRTTARMHEAGIAHKDYGRANILFDLTDEGVIIELVDLNRMARGTFDMKRGCKNFERLPATPQMHQWLGEAYAAARGLDAESCIRLIKAYRSTQPGKIEGKY